MIVNVERYGTDDEPAEVMTRLVPAVSLQPYMLFLDEQTGELHPVVADPEPFLRENEHGRDERWVTLHLHEAEPMEQVAANRVAIVFGAPADGLQDLPPSDMLTVEDEALARNGMCHHRIEPDVEDEQHEEEPDPVWCGAPSDPESPFRFCTPHDEARIDDSNQVAAHGFSPIYAPYAPI
jgi:hypothetical protein